MRNIAGKCLSMNTTFKLATKATVVDKQRKRHKVGKGGMLNVINELSEIVAWVSTCDHHGTSSIDCRV